MAQTLESRPGADAPIVNRPPNRRSPWLVQFYGTAVGKKWVMALTGIGLWGFVLAHMVGNLKVYMGDSHGEPALDIYGEGLRTLLYPILPHHTVVWALRIGLIVMFAFHIHSAITLTQMNRRARPVDYKAPREYIAANFASRSMRITGVIVLAYLVFHLFDLSWTGTGADFVRGHVKHNLIGSLQRPVVALAYLVANAALAVHLYHGLWSMFQSMGINNPRWNQVRRSLALGMAVIVGAPNVLFPILIVTKVVS